ncbi:hypothetical protein BLOT_008137 [Blomia tropicalis]|nr:hypothetical protein BLOT_008137 [Blomia tropicalis]
MSLQQSFFLILLMNLITFICLIKAQQFCPYNCENNYQNFDPNTEEKITQLFFNVKFLFKKQSNMLYRNILFATAFLFITLVHAQENVYWNPSSNANDDSGFPDIPALPERINPQENPKLNLQLLNQGLNLQQENPKLNLQLLNQGLNLQQENPKRNLRLLNLNHGEKR